jgi:hypothetical protein
MKIVSSSGSPRKWWCRCWPPPQRADFRLLGEGEEKPDDEPDRKRAQCQRDGDEEASGDLVAPARISAGQERSVRQQVEKAERAAERIEQRRKPIQLLSQRCRRFHAVP